jgi:hypothetical protein
MPETARNLHPKCGRSSAGRAPPCQGGCREFESRRPLAGHCHGNGPLRTGAYTVGWPRGEAAACKAVYTGSNPVPTSVKTMVSGSGRWQWAIGAAVARFPDTEEVTGSIPVSPTKQGNLLHAVRTAQVATHFIRGRSSAGRAPPCQGGCREFESRRPLSSSPQQIPLDRASGSGRLAQR